MAEIRHMEWHSRLQALLCADLDQAFEDPAFQLVWRRLIEVVYCLTRRSAGQPYPLTHDQSVALMEASTDDIADLSSCREELLRVLPQCAPQLAAVYGRYLPEFIEELIGHMLGLDMSATVGRMVRMSPDNPLTVTGDDTLAGWREAKPEHFLAFGDYRASLRPLEEVKARHRPKGSGTGTRPRQKDETRLDAEAALAYQMKSDGHDWRAIAPALEHLFERGDFVFDKHNERARERVRKKVGDRVYRGRMNARHKS